MNEHLLFKGKTKEELLDLLLVYQRALGYNLIASVTDLDGKILYANKLFCDVSKYQEAEVIGARHILVNSGHHSDDFFRMMWTTLKKGELWHGEIRNKDRTGGLYWVDTLIVPLKDSEGNVFQYFCLQTDVSGKKKFEEEKINMLRETEELLNMTSHRVRAPVATCLGLIQLVELDTMGPGSTNEILFCLSRIKESVLELDTFTKEFTKHLTQLHERKKFK